jgi:arylsulfatase A-like enzyme
MTKKKNILFICTDQHRFDSLAFNNKNTICKTPNLDKLSEESVVFSNSYASCPVCTPARSSMQSGLFPSTTGMETNSFQTGCRTHELPDNPLLLSRRLIERGYNPLYTGKWHLGVGKDKTKTFEGTELLRVYDELHEWDVKAFENYGTLPTEIGYTGDDFPGHGNGGWHFKQFQSYLKENNLTLEIENTTGHKNPGDHSTVGEVKSPIESTIEYYLVERSKTLIDDQLNDDKPFYLNLNFWGPHEPFFAPTEYLKMYENVHIPEWNSFSESAEGQPKMLNILRRPEQPWSFFEDTLRHYYAVISHIDCQIGRLISYLKEKNLYDDTMIIFSADHGDYQGTHGGLENKSYGMYDDITKIPLMIKPAESNFEGYKTDALVGTCDFYATILDEAGDNGNMGDGRSLLPFLKDKNPTWDDEIMSEGLGACEVIATQRMYRKGDIKYVFNGVDKDQLFDLKNDPEEMNDLLETEPELLREMRLSFASYLKKHNFPIYNLLCRMNNLNEWDFSKEK